MSTTAFITVEGAWAKLHRVPMLHLSKCLSFDDPSRWFNRAFKEGRWDGKVRLYQGRRFPAGLVQHVIQHLNDEGIDVRTTGFETTAEVDLSKFDAMYLGSLDSETGAGLWPHQVEAVHTLLRHTRGVVKAATGSGKTACLAVAAKLLWEDRGWRSLVIVPSKDLLDQTVKRLQDYYQGYPSVGQFGGGVRELGDVVVGTAQTLIKFKSSQRKKRGSNSKITVPPDPALQKIVRNFEVLLVDEAHHTSATTWFEIAMRSQAHRRYGFSGTPDKKHIIADMRLVGATGPIIFDIAADTLIEAGLAAKPKIVMVMSREASGPDLGDLTYDEAYQQGLVENAHHNRAVVRAATWLVDHGRQTLVICRRREHWERLRTLLDATGIDFHAVWGDTDQEVRNEAKRQLQTRQTQCVLATTIWDEGTDVPAIGGLVLAEGVKSSTNARQRIGRGMRIIGGTDDVWVVDFIPMCHAKLQEHGLARCVAYESEGYEVLAQYDWSEDDALLFPFERWDEALVAQVVA